MIVVVMVGRGVIGGGGGGGGGGGIGLFENGSGPRSGSRIDLDWLYASTVCTPRVHIERSITPDNAT